MSTVASRLRERPPSRLEERITIEPDGTVVARSGKVEYGQGIRTGFAKIVAEELAVPLHKVRVELGETDRVPWDMGTFGSMSTATDGKILRIAAATARETLLRRAAVRFGLAVSELRITEGVVVAPGSRSVTYQELVENEPLTGILSGDESFSHAISSPETCPLRIEALAIVTGTAKYAGDFRLPNMLWGQVSHAPVQGARIKAIDEHLARGLAGVVAIVRDEDFVGVVAQKSHQALAAIRALHVEWERPSQAATTTRFDVVLRRDPDIDAAFMSGDRHVAAKYYVPHISHVPIGPSAAVADVREHGADLYVSTQRPFGLRDEVSQLLQLAPEVIHVHPQMMSGTYGRANRNDAPMDAVRLSRAVKRPVLVQWGREEEFRCSPHRPVLHGEIAAALASDGRIVAWRYISQTNLHTYGGGGSFPPGVLEMTSGRNAVPPYHVGAAEILLHVTAAPIRTGAFRSLAAAPNTFVIESFMDELAHISGQDPIAFHLRHIEDDRLRRVVMSVRQQSNWEQRTHKPGRGLGFACAIYHGTYIAQVAEVTVDAAGGQVRVERIWCAVDAGRLVHQDGARNQIEGGVQQAASWTLFEELQIHNSEVTARSLQDYQIASFHEAIREMDIAFLPAAEFPATGVGEPGSVPVAAAIANAVFDACGARIRRLPLTRETVVRGITTK